MSLATASLTSGNSILAHHIIKNIVGHVLLHIRRCFFSYGKMINLSNAYQLHHPEEKAFRVPSWINLSNAYQLHLRTYIIYNYFRWINLSNAYQLHRNPSRRKTHHRWINLSNAYQLHPTGAYDRTKSCWINLSNAYQLHQKVHNSLLLFIIKVFPSDKNPQAKDFQQPLLGKIPILILYFCFEQYFLLHCNLHVLPYHNSGILGFGIQNECYLVLRAEQLHIHYTFDL